MFAAGVAALLVAPFLTWFNYGLSTLFPSQVSLIWLFERGYRILLALYLLGVTAALFVTGIVRKPVAFVGALPAAFPLFILTITLTTFFDGSQGYTQALTVGVLTALFGSALLESLYFVYRERADRGFGVLFTEQGRVPFYNKLTDMEYSYFTTKPEEVGRQISSASVAPIEPVQPGP